MRRSILMTFSAITALGIVSAVVVGVLLNNPRQPHPRSAQAQPTATATTPAQPTATSTEQASVTCGSLNYAAGRLMTGTSVARASATCFVKALSGCHSATLNVKVMGVDTDTVYHFSVSSACKTTLDFTNTVIGRPTATITATCQSVTDSAYGLEFKSCGTLGDIHLATT